MAMKLFNLAGTAVLVAVVTACILLAAPRLPDGGWPYLAAVPWVLISASLAPLATGHLLALTRAPVCRYGSSCVKGRAFHWLFAAMLIVAAGALLAIAVAGLTGLHGRGAGALFFCAGMCGAMQALIVPGFCFDWVPHSPAHGGEADRGGQALWILRPGGYTLRGLSGSPNRHRVLKEWAAWGLAMSLAYVPVAGVALLPLLLGNAIRVSDPSPRQPLDGVALALAATLSLIAPLAARVILQLALARPGPMGGSRIADAGVARTLTALSVGGAAVAMISSFFVWVPYWAGFVALLLSFSASQAAFLASIFAGRPG
jgi:hypothetical protein